MRHEKIIVREDGTKVRIVVNFHADYIGEGYAWSGTSQKCEKGKRKFTGNNIATTDELYKAQIELWEKLKPTL